MIILQLVNMLCTSRLSFNYFRFIEGGVGNKYFQSKFSLFEVCFQEKNKEKDLF